MKYRILALFLTISTVCLSGSAFGATIKSGNRSDNAEPIAKCDIGPTISRHKAPVTNPEGERHVYESSCRFMNNYTGGSQFDFGRTHYVYPVDDDLYIDNLWIRGTYVKATFTDEDHTMLEFCSGQEVGEVMGEEQLVPVFFGCAVMNENGTLGLMDRIYADVDAEGRISISDHAYFGTQYFIIYDESGNVYSIEYQHNFWEIDPTITGVPENLEKEFYLYDYTQQGYENSPKQRILTMWRDGDDVYLDGLVPYLDSESTAGVAKGSYKYGNIVIPVPQLLMINGSYTERLFAYKDGEPLENLILYYDESKQSFSPGNGVVVYGGSGYYSGYCYGFNNIAITRFDAENIAPKDPYDVAWSDAFDNYFTFKFDTTAPTGESLYKGWMGVEVFVDGELFTFNPSDYNGLLNTMTRIPLRSQLIEILDAGNFIYWGNIEVDEADTFAILLPSYVESEDVGVRLVYTVDGQDNYSEIVAVPAGGTEPPVADDGKRVVVLEEFSTEKCPNCPAATDKLEQVMENLTDEEKAHLLIVTHHAGYYTDFLTQPCDEELTWFYGGQYTYAPAFMVDRTAAGDDETPVFQCPSSWQLLRSKIQNAMKREAGSTVAMKGQADGNTLNLSVTGTLSDSESNTDNLRVTAYILENNVQSQNQAGADASYIHNHVIRAYNGEAFGKQPVFDGNDWQSDATLSIPEGNTEAYEVAAFISRYNPDDRTDCKILNAYRISLPELLAGSSIEMVTDEPIEERWFDLTGVEVSKPATHGVFLRVQSFANGRSKATKIIR